MRIDRSKFTTILSPEKSQPMMKVIQTGITPRGHFRTLCVQSRLLKGEHGAEDKQVSCWTEVLSPRPIENGKIPDIQVGDAITIDSARHRESGLNKTVALWGNPRTIGKFDRESDSVGLYAVVADSVDAGETLEGNDDDQAS